MTPLLSIERGLSGIAHIILNRPEARNALNLSLMTELCDAIRDMEKSADTRVVIFRGEGPMFCAGLDLKEAMDGAKAHVLAEKVAETLSTIYHSPLVAIAAIHGAAIAGGAGIASACDLVIATDETKIGFPETRKGLVAAIVLSLLKRQILDRHVRELLLTGELISADRAERIGLINRVVKAEHIQEEAEAMALNILKGGPEATKRSKKLITDLDPSSLDTDLRIALDIHRQTRLEEEAEEGIRAFNEKRPPSWASQL
jgi:methylglutaconyl-CoA hydratase